MSSDNPPDADQAVPRRPRIKSLDGVRAFAISMVVASHAANHEGVRLPLIEGTYLENLIRMGGRWGVLIFFTLSGYLITTLLAEEERRRGRVSLSRFWYRRALRIFPVFYTFLAVVAVAVACGVFEIRWGVFGVAAAYLTNYQFLFIDPHSTGADYAALGHLWTLAVEEQFYLLFPLVVWWFGRRGALAACVALVLTAPLVRVGQYLLAPSLREFGSIMGHTMFGVSIAIGCVWALAESLRIAPQLRSAASSRPVFGTAAVYAFLVHPLLEMRFGGAWSVTIGESLAGLAYMVMIAHVVRFADGSTLGRVLNAAPVVWLGLISYSLYVWHQPLMMLDVPGVPVLASRALLVAAAIVVAAASYHGLEKPILDRREALWRWLGKARSITGFERVA